MVHLTSGNASDLLKYGIIFTWFETLVEKTTKKKKIRVIIRTVKGLAKLQTLMWLILKFLSTITHLPNRDFEHSKNFQQSALLRLATLSDKLSGSEVFIPPDGDSANKLVKIPANTGSADSGCRNRLSADPTIHRTNNSNCLQFSNFLPTHSSPTSQPTHSPYWVHLDLFTFRSK